MQSALPKHRSLGRAEVLNGHGVGGVHAFEEGVGFGRALGDNGRIGKDGQLVGERVFFVNGVAAVFIGVIQTEGRSQPSPDRM